MREPSVSLCTLPPLLPCTLTTLLEEEEGGVRLLRGRGIRLLPTDEGLTDALPAVADAAVVAANVVLVRGGGDTSVRCVVVDEEKKEYIWS